MLESIYNGLLLLLAIWGAIRAGIWLVGRRWAWYWKILACLVVVSAIGGFVQQLGGGPKTDLAP